MKHMRRALVLCCIGLVVVALGAFWEGLILGGHPGRITFAGIVLTLCGTGWLVLAACFLILKDDDEF